MRLPEREGDWQIIIGTLMPACSIVLVLLAESKNRQAETILKEAKQTVKEACK